jgi:hypothetical protein
MNKNDFYSSGVIKNSFIIKVKVCGYKDDELKSITSLLSSLSKKINNSGYSEDYSSQIDKDNYMINSSYFYNEIIKNIDFGFTYSFIIGYKDKFLTKDNIAVGSIIYTLPKISYENAKFIDNNKVINLKLNGLNRDFIFKLPKLYRDLDVNIEDLESFISYKMLLRYEILKLQ